MWKQATLTAFLVLSGGAARADFSLVCDEKAQVLDVLQTTRDKGFEAAKEKFRAYIALKNEQDQPSCELSEALEPASVGDVVARFDEIEFLPDELHDVVIVEIRVGDHSVFGTINRYVAPKAAQVGL